MSSVTMHPEAVKAAIRMRHGTLVAFAAINGFNVQAVRDMLRGMSSTAKPATAELLGLDPDQLIISTESTSVELNSKDRAPSTSLFVEAR